jgi:hypothetical protein
MVWSTREAATSALLIMLFNGIHFKTSYIHFTYLSSYTALFGAYIKESLESGFISSNIWHFEA